MRRWMSLLLVITAAYGLRTALSALPLHPPPGQTVNVYAPPGVEAAGSRVPLLYLEEDGALFLPQGAGDATHAVVPGPSELVELLRREDIVIVTVDVEPAASRATAPAGWSRLLIRAATSVLGRW
jgi:hypothetical protein